MKLIIEISTQEEFNEVHGKVMNALKELYPNEMIDISYDVQGVVLYDADPNCKHDIESGWTGLKCRKCPGWFCY